MKKFLFVISLVLFGLTSCVEGPRGPAGPPGPSNVLISIPVEVRNANFQHTWVYQGGHFSAFIPVPELTRGIFNNGAIMVYRKWFDRDINDWLGQPLPFTLPLTDGVNLWTEQFDFDFGVGNVVIYFTVSDFFYDGAPGTQNFRIVLLR